MLLKTIDARGKFRNSDVGASDELKSAYAGTRGSVITTEINWKII